jgi:hypothetical protein
MEPADLAAQLAVDFAMRAAVSRYPQPSAQYRREAAELSPHSVNIAGVDDAFSGSEAIASGAITRARLRWNHRAVFPDVYEDNKAGQH